MKIISLYDGMSCGMIALKALGLQISEYHAWEIDKYANAVSRHNFPEIIRHGDVTTSDFTMYKGANFVMAGFPCTKFSIAQKNGRETTPYSGVGWILFEHAWRAVTEAEPMYFLFENNKSMAKPIQEEISRIVGFKPILINSALVSAQNRQRLYWVGKREQDGTYSKVDVQQPEDKGMLLRDILESGEDLTQNEKRYVLTDSYDGAVAWNTIERSQRNMVAEPINTSGDKALTIKAQYYKNGIANFFNDNSNGCKYAATGVAEPVCLNSKSGRGRVDGLQPSLADRIYDINGKGTAVTTAFHPNIAEPVCLRYERTEEAKACRKDYESGLMHHGFHEMSELHPRNDGKTNTLSTVLKDNLICEPIGVGFRNRREEDGKLYRRFETHGEAKANAVTTVQTDSMVATPVRIGVIESGERSRKSDSQAIRVYSCDGKSVNLLGQGGGAGAKTGLYAVPITQTKDGKSFAITANYEHISDYPNDYAAHSIEKSVKPVVAVPYAGQETPSKVYEVRDGMITIKDKQYPIKLADGDYIIRKLTVRECMRLQTVPDWYDFSVISNSQAYKCLGNGWTCDVITHLIKSALSSEEDEKC